VFNIVNTCTLCTISRYLLFRPYTPNNGLPSTVWFDRKQISPQSPEDVDSINDMCHCLDEIVADEVAHGIPHKRIIIGKIDESNN